MYKVCAILLSIKFEEVMKMATITPERMKQIIESERWIQESEASRELGMPGKPAKVVDIRDLMKGVKK